MSKDAYYFPHDCNAHNDPKIGVLIQKNGYEGYGLYWGLIEILHESGGVIKRFPKVIEGLAVVLRTNEAVLRGALTTMIDDCGLLKMDETHIWSERVIRNIQEREAKRAKKVESGTLGGIHSGINRSEKKHRLKQNEANEPKESKVKERKVFIRPAVEDISAYFKEIGFAQEASQFYDYYEANGWRIGRNPMKDWRATARYWQRNNFGSNGKQKGGDNSWFYQELEKKMKDKESKDSSNTVVTTK